MLTERTHIPMITYAKKKIRFSQNNTFFYRFLKFKFLRNTRFTDHEICQANVRHHVA